MRDGFNFATYEYADNIEKQRYCGSFGAVVFDDLPFVAQHPQNDELWKMLKERPMFINRELHNSWNSRTGYPFISDFFQDNGYERYVR